MNNKNQTQKFMREYTDVVFSQNDLLSESEQAVLKMRGKGFNLEQCGGSLNLSKERIRQIETKGLKKMKEFLYG